jgi:hypothetical protein
MAIPPIKPVQAPVAVVEPARPTRTVFCLRSIKWKDADGRQRSALQYEDAALPLPLADKALRSGACVSITDDRRKTLKGARGGHHPNVDALDIVDLDAIEDWSGAHYTGPDANDALASTNITVIDRGPERKGTIAVHRVL